MTRETTIHQLVADDFERLEKRICCTKSMRQVYEEVLDAILVTLTYTKEGKSPRERLRDREKRGLETYEEYLFVDNLKRTAEDALSDFLEEIEDASVYLKEYLEKCQQENH